MSDNVDDNDMSFESGGEAESAAPPKAKGAGPGILRILMFVGIGLGAVIFIVTIVVITVNVLKPSGKQAQVVALTENYQETVPPYQYNTTLGSIRAMTKDAEPFMVQVKINLGFELADKEESKNVTDFGPRMRDRLRNYFNQKTQAELTPDNEETIKAEIREELNRIIGKDEIKEILFDQFDVVKQ